MFISNIKLSNYLGMKHTDCIINIKHKSHNVYIIGYSHNNKITDLLVCSKQDLSSLLNNRHTKMSSVVSEIKINTSKNYIINSFVYNQWFENHKLKEKINIILEE